MLNFEMYEDVLDRRKRNRKHLRSGNSKQRQVARHLNACRKNTRCETEACRVCLREFRIGWIGEVTKVIVQKPHWTTCSIITKDLLVPYGSLQTFNLKAAIKRIQKRLERSQISDRIVIGGLDISLNLNSNNLVGWQIHMYLLVEGKNDKVLRRAIKAAFAGEPSAAKPYQFRAVEDPVEAISYAYKSVFMRRSTYIDADGKTQTRDLPLKGRDLRELLQLTTQSRKPRDSPRGSP
jgi:hypothetical protein